MINLDLSNPGFGSFDPSRAPRLPWGCYTTTGALVARAPTRKAAATYAKRFGYSVAKIG